MEVWFADEARVGQKNKITRRWARRGSRPSAPQDQRTASAYIFGAVCPREGKGAALVLPFCSSAAMSLHLIPDPADRLSKVDRPPPCAVTAVALINRIPYEGALHRSARHARQT
jgi:hypothetical protein